MLNNHFKIAWRNLLRNKTFSLINIGGLSLGIGASLLLFIIISYELSYNKSIPNADNIYQLGTVMQNEATEQYTTGVPNPALDAYRNGLPDITFAPLVGQTSSQISLADENGNIHPDKKFNDDIFFTDQDFFKIFDFKWISGNTEVLQKPNTLVLTKTQAEKYFTNWENALYKSVHINNKITVEVAGIIEDIPLNTDFPFYTIISYLTYKNNPDIFGYEESWGSNSSNERIYAFIPNHISNESVNQRIDAISTPFYSEVNPNENRRNYLLPLKEIHYDTRFDSFGKYTISKNTLLMLSLIGIFILVMGCINFINISTAQAINRSKEIGIRKVLGSDRTNIFWQLIGETGILVFCSMLVGLLLAKMALPHIETLIGITEKIPLFNIQNFIYLMILGVIVSFVAGSYPALVISGFKPVIAMKGKPSTPGKVNLRRALVVLQFVISQTLIIGTMIAILQMNMVKNSDLGFTKEAIFVLNSKIDSTVMSRQSLIKSTLESINGVSSISFANATPSSSLNNATNMSYNRGPDEKFHLFYKTADENYFKTFNIPLIAGRGYLSSDSARSVVINETLVKKLNISNPEEVLGKEIRMGSQRYFTVVGVVKDFVTNSLRSDIQPLLILPNPSTYSTISVKINSTNLVSSQKQILEAWNKVYPEYIVTDYWFDDQINRFYQQENQLTLIYKIFSGIAIFLSCLGLYGLISFTTVQKRKEVGIRKVVGASVNSILVMFSKEITILITIALFISIPTAWWISSKWLEIFSQKITIDWKIFLVAALGSLVIAWITIFTKAYKAAISNPVSSLRDE